MAVHPVSEKEGHLKREQLLVRCRGHSLRGTEKGYREAHLEPLFSVIQE